MDNFEFRFTKAFVSAMSPADRQEARRNALTALDNYHTIISIIDAIDGVPAGEAGYLTSIQQANKERS